ncbi:LysE family translocator [Streptosporangium lutulentum]|uniref:Threonine/homoserine/homoserine lactone efflux protein n=1 Tax=Streptosporangium lutulentum TaxID=1461250 RepID=A0ABT9QNU3_9ACTN|nr:LysE family translocator [Streptosporangium lutulentum]MDP9847584.1 threonine/homoserine/homoserine lactone efflux protein [Streptosporangium lutulentum]
MLVSLIPGANQLLGLSNAVRHGSAHALAGLGGRLAAFVILVGLVVAGLGAALAASATALTVIKWVGVAYLAWIGFVSLRRAWRASADPDLAAPTSTGRKGVRPLIVNEFVVAMSNPKLVLFTAALLPQFTGGPKDGAGAQLALLGGAYLGIEIVVGLGYIGLGGRLGATGIPARTRRRVDLGSGVCFVGLAGLLAADDLV